MPVIEPSCYIRALSNVFSVECVLCEMCSLQNVFTIESSAMPVIRPRFYLAVLLLTTTNSNPPTRLPVSPSPPPSPPLT